MEETYKGKLSYNRLRMIHAETKDTQAKKDPSIESRGSEWTPFLSNLLKELRCS